MIIYQKIIIMIKMLMIVKKKKKKKEEVVEEEGTFTKLIGILFKILMIGIIPPVIYIIKGTYTTLIERDYLAKEKGYRYPKLYDLNFALICTVIIFVSRYILTKTILKNIGEYIVNSNTDNHDVRLERFAHVQFKFIYFTLSTLWGWVLLRDSDFLPVEMLGKSTKFEHVFKNYPWQSNLTMLHKYYLVQLAYHLHSLVYQFSSFKRNDFVEMVLHHSCTAALIIFSYYHNYLKIGCLILIIHDFGDVFGYLMKSVIDTKKTSIILSAYGLLLLTWGYTRLYVFPFVIIQGTEIGLKIIPDDILGPYRILRSFLIILQILHVYWYGLFIYMGWRFSKKGKAVDVQMNIENQKKIN